VANLGDGDGGTDICRQRKTPPYSEYPRRAATPCAIFSHHLRRSHAYWIEYCHRWLLEHGLSADRVRQRVYVWTPRLVLSSAGRLMCICAVCRSYDDDELAHYSLATTDLEYKFVVSSAAWHCHRCGCTHWCACILWPGIGLGGASFGASLTAGATTWNVTLKALV